MRVQYGLWILAIFKIFCAAALIPLPNFESQCETRCPLQNQTDELHGDGECGTECIIKQCSRGCELWQSALESSCQVVCNGTQELLPLKELYCVMGCNDAINRYFHELKALIGIPAAPALVADTLTATSLSLEWDGPRFANISYLVQWRYEKIADIWQYCRNQTWGPYTTVTVENLQPYTKYRFRIALLLSAHHSDPIVSEPSLVISTLPGGPPTSPPTIVRTTAADPTRVSVSWEPGPFPNGPILSYMLQINQLPHGYQALKDIPASENKDFYMFQNLAPARNYSVSVSMRNAAGQGPPATAYVSTPTLSQVKETQQPILILGAQHTVDRQSTDILDAPVTIYTTAHHIKGVAVHIARGLLFISDSSGKVWVTSMRDNTEPRSLLPEGSKLLPHNLSVDWLNDLLYLVVEAGDLWQVLRCGLDGSGITVAVAGLLNKPHHMEVDPYNGYLFWVFQGPVGGGLYRLDLADISNGVKHEVTPDLILASPHLGAFTVDHKSFRILVPDQSKNTVYAVSLDGHEVANIRNNTVSPQFSNVISLATANNLFYWTNGKEMLSEDTFNGTFYHTKKDMEQPLMSISVNLASSQPVPVPVNPPTAVQAVMGSHFAKISWTVPHLLGGQGKGAWQNWSYQLSIRDVETDVTVVESKNINATYYTVGELQPSKEYLVRTAAYTSAGAGPWSSEFQGRTLRQTSDPRAPAILWSAAEGLLRSDVTGERVETLIHRDSLRDRKGYHHITDMAWFRDRLYLVSNTSHVHWYNVTSHTSGRLRDMDSVGSISVDWVGHKLYWSNLKQQLIIRGNLNGSQPEPLPILTVAKELNVDAVEGFIYWSTGHAVESSRLNGKHKKVYYPAEFTSWKQVMGLTIDMDTRSVYWIVRSDGGSSLFRADTAEKLKYGEEIQLQEISSLQYPNMQGPLCYFDNHLVWLRDDRYAVIGDMKGQNSAVLSGMRLSGLNKVTIMDHALHHSPKGRKLSEINVIPHPVSQRSLRVEGDFEAFRICWDRVHNVNYGQVFYEIKISNQNKDFTGETTEPYWVYEGASELIPYSVLHVSVRAMTYWGGSPFAQALLHSPPSIPSPPTNPRVFVSFKRTPFNHRQNIIAVFRWGLPAYPNGVIVKYKVTCSQVCEDTEVPADSLEFIVPDLPDNSTIYFQAAACTEVGCGDFSPRVFGDSTEESPKPQLLLSTSAAVQITDCDNLKDFTVSRSPAVVDLAYSSQDNRVYWIDDSNHLVTFNLYTSEKTKLVSLNNTGTSLAIDWVGRFLYWAEKRYLSQTSHVYSLDLNTNQISQRLVIRRPVPVVKLQVYPFNSMLYWVEERLHGVGTLMKSFTDGSNVQPFFYNIRNPGVRRLREACNCPEEPSVGSAITIDLSDQDEPQLVFYDTKSNQITAADMDGCSCTSLLDASIYSPAGLPPTSMTVDQRLVYWSNASEGRIYILNKNLDNFMSSGVSSINASGVHNIASFGSHLQPYPDVHCLKPKETQQNVELVNRTDHSITLQLPLPQQDRHCGNISLATIKFTVYYGQENTCAKNITLCSSLDTYDDLLTVENLQEQTNYTFFLAYSNHYSELQEIRKHVGNPVTFKTFSSDLLAPQIIRVTPLDPTSLRVFWRQSSPEAVHYQVFCQREGVLLEERYQLENHLREDNSTDVMFVDMSNLMPGHEYVLWVRTRVDFLDKFADSKQVNATTYAEPKEIVLEKASATALNVSWTKYPDQPQVQSQLESSTYPSLDWTTVPLQISSDSIDFFVLKDLMPKTQYIFRLKLHFSNMSGHYYWPPDKRFTFETLGDCPSRPGVPKPRQLISNNDKIQIIWDEPIYQNGASVRHYWLEGRTDPGVREKRDTNLSSIDSLSDDQDWLLYYNGSASYCLLEELNPQLKYQFRVKAWNKYGWSEYSEASDWFSFSLGPASKLPQQEMGIIMWVFIPLAVLALILTLMCFMCTVVTKREKEKKMQHLLTMNPPILRASNTDVELATLRELPRRPNFIQSTNALYTAADLIPTDREIALLPHIRRENITLTNFLGSGAFGEVLEGKARSLPGLAGIETRVAIKTLRKGASQQEKQEFLKEAQLMSNFKHDNILQLLGVCLDNDPHFIIMELMEGGDLLDYLRSHRPLATSSSLTMLDLLSICVDVARGCHYLEEMHFVHRDLACRNCLVSSKDPRYRVVKIGDFGLARDIYKNDYYRKEGEGLLPVRWMAPESLVDGVFTSQSDVWAFGVLLWEIMTLGQQPYPARNNLEVLHYVRNGGRLSCPPNCSHQMYNLMLRCWSFKPEERPLFIYCLEVVMDLRNKVSNALESNITDSSDDSKQEWRNLREDSGSTPGGTHKYLELIYDEGYEVPRPPPQQYPQLQQLQSVEREVQDKLLPSAYSNMVEQLALADSITENTASYQDTNR